MTISQRNFLMKEQLGNKVLSNTKIYMGYQIFEVILIIGVAIFQVTSLTKLLKGSSIIWFHKLIHNIYFIRKILKDFLKWWSMMIQRHVRCQWLFKLRIFSMILINSILYFMTIMSNKTLNWPCSSVS